MDDNIHNLRDALEWLDRRIREEAEYDGEMTNEHAIELAFIQSMLAKFPLRNCDVGTVGEQAKRFNDFCSTQICNKYVVHDKMVHSSNDNIPERAFSCRLVFSQLPYEAEEGATDAT